MAVRVKRTRCSVSQSARINTAFALRADAARGLVISCSVNRSAACAFAIVHNDYTLTAYRLRLYTALRVGCDVCMYDHGEKVQRSHRIRQQ